MTPQEKLAMAQRMAADKRLHPETRAKAERAAILMQALAASTQTGDAAPTPPTLRQAPRP